MAISTLKSELKQFAENTTFHGVANIINHPKHPVWMRLTWMFFFLLMLSIYFFMLSQTLTKYYKYPVVTNVEYRTTDSITFPSVTICNFNIFRYSAILQDNTGLFIMNIESTTRELYLPEPREPENNSEVDWVKLNYKWAHQPEDMYLECAFDNQHQASCNVQQRGIMGNGTRGSLSHLQFSADYQQVWRTKILLDLEGSMGLICSLI